MDDKEHVLWINRLEVLRPLHDKMFTSSLDLHELLLHLYEVGEGEGENEQN
jgi:hypothetical protein